MQTDKIAIPKMPTLAFESDEQKRVYCLEKAFQMCVIDQSATVLEWANKIDGYLLGEGDGTAT